MNHDKTGIVGIFPDVIWTVGDVLERNSRKHRSSGITGYWHRTRVGSGKTYWTGRDIEVAQLRNRNSRMNIADHAVDPVARLSMRDVHSGILGKQHQTRLENPEEHKTQQNKHSSRD